MKHAIFEENLIQVAISDDHAIVRQALKRAFLYHGKIQVVVEASGYSELLEMLFVSRTKIVIMDLNMPDLSSTINTIHQIHQIIPDAKILILTMHNDDRIKQELIKAGIYSFIHKAADFELLTASIIMAAEKSTAKLHIRNGEYNGCNARDRNDFQNGVFSEREKIILKLIAGGKTNIEISRIIFLSVRSIEQIRHKMKERANVTNTASLIDFAIRNKLIE